MNDTIEQNWYFTFGHGHRAIAVSRARRDIREPQPHGFRLDNRYVVIHGTESAARKYMIAIFGLIWAGQYHCADAAGVTEYGLTELVLTGDWMPTGQYIEAEERRVEAERDAVEELMDPPDVDMADGPDGWYVGRIPGGAA